jgi:hypothetical protein
VAKRNSEREKKLIYIAALAFANGALIVMGPGSDCDFQGAEERSVSSQPSLPQDPLKWTTGQDCDTHRLAVQRWAQYIKLSSPFKEFFKLIEATLFQHFVAQLNEPS